MIRNLIIDQITLHNRKEVFAYTGDIDGQFIEQEGAKVHVGEYTDGAPRITDGLFMRKYTVEYPNEQMAHEAALSACGKAAILNMLFGEVYTIYIKRQDGLWKRAENGVLIPVSATKH